MKIMGTLNLWSINGVYILDIVKTSGYSNLSLDTLVHLITELCLLKLVLLTVVLKQLLQEN